MIPFLYPLLDPDKDTFFVSASDALQELLDSSPLSDSDSQAGRIHLAQPILAWLDLQGTKILQNTLQTGNVDEISHSTCKLLSALGDHSTAYLCQNVVNNTVPTLSSEYGNIFPPGQKTNGQLVQNYLRVMLDYTGLPGYYGVDEESSELTNTFWYLFQESLWETSWADHPESLAGDPNAVVKAVYVELVRILQRKCQYPPEGHGWPKGKLLSTSALLL